MRLRLPYLLFSTVRSRRPTDYTILSKRCFGKETEFEQKCSSVIYQEHGDPIKVLEVMETMLSKPKKSQVLIKMLASPINPADINMIQGTYPIKPELPAIGGNEGVGEVVSIGSKAKSLNVGDRVLPAKAGLGTWRSHIVCSPDELTHVSKKLSIIQAASLSINPCTAYRMLKDFETLEEGDVVIQNAGNSAVGKAVIQIASKLKLITINVVRNRPDIETLTESLLSLGATHVITEEFLRSPDMKEILNGFPQPKLGLNAVGGMSGAALLKFLAPGGTFVTYGGMSKQPLMVPAGPLIFNDVKLKGFWMSRWTNENCGSEEQKEMIAWLTNLMIKGKFQVPEHEFNNINEFQSAIKKSMEPFSNKKQIFLFDSDDGPK